MSTADFDAPDASREGSLSSLDFVYYVLDGVDTYHDHTELLPDFIGSADDEEMSMDQVVFNAEIVGVTMPQGFDKAVEFFEAKADQITVRTALRKRGALLVKNRGIAISLGDTRRVVEARDGEYIVRFLNAAEKVEGFWTNAVLLPGMRYM